MLVGPQSTLRIELERLLQCRLRLLQKTGQKRKPPEVAMALHVEWIKHDHSPAKRDRFVQAANIPSLSYDGAGDYFLIHHTEADTVDKIDPKDVARAAAAIGVMAYVVADLPKRLGEP